MNPAEDWLRERLHGAPPELLDEMSRAIRAGDHSIPDALAEGALSLFAQLSRGCEARHDAWPLLVADALLTHALEAQAELDPAGIAALAQRLGPNGRIGTLADALGAQEP